jgi:preprotein translocase subunit SecF
MQIIKPDINIDFMGKRYIAYALSAILIITGMVALIMRGGPNYGVDFSGGLMIQIKLTSPQDISDIRDALRAVNFQDATIQSLGEEGDAEYLIRKGESPDIRTETLNNDLSKAIKDKFGEGSIIERLEMVGPKVGKDLREKALAAIFYSMLLIAVYISGRFEQKWTLSIIMMVCFIVVVLLGISLGASITWLILIAFITSLVFCWVLRLRYAMSAIMSLIHDVLITVGAFAITNKEISLTVVAAILTLIGYSLNDTIVTFDRIREKLRNTPGKKDLAEIANRSVNETLSRTIITDGTVLAVVVALFFLGGVVIHDFAFAMLIGSITGVYSTIFIASPLLLLWKDKPVRMGKRG